MFPQIPPITCILLVTNVAVYLLYGHRLEGLFALWPLDSIDSPYSAAFHPWQLVTYAFLHGGTTHLLFNMLALFMFGSEIERLLGTRRYVLYYFACVIGAALTQLTVLKLMQGPPFPTVGASGGVFGLLLAYGMAFPHRKLMLLFPPIPMKAWVFVTLYGVMELVLGVTGTQQGVAHFAHLGGMAAGFLLIHVWKKSTPRNR